MTLILFNAILYFLYNNYHLSNRIRSELKYYLNKIYTLELNTQRKKSIVMYLIKINESNKKEK